METENVAEDIAENIAENTTTGEENTQRQRWNWPLIEKLILSGKSNREILQMPEFKGMSYNYLKNKAAKFGLHKKAEEVNIIAHGAVGKSVAEKRTAGIEEHHLFTFEQLEKMRKAILEHKVTGKVQDLRSMMTLFQQYIDAAEKSYGLNGKDMDERAISLNAMVALHVIPPQRDEKPIVAMEVAHEELQADQASSFSREIS